MKFKKTIASKCVSCEKYFTDIYMFDNGMLMCLTCLKEKFTEIIDYFPFALKQLDLGKEEKKESVEEMNN